ncbi:hypothetical protein Q8G35_06930 [Peribacillus simplex]|uniref:Uncharacterized protein n=2 Tax=Peribacillus TaxID=2675229 RepID=A0AA90SK27_9BACI|nr:MULTISPECIES: hypothetical protein [Peribacillus]MDP1418140.1 hypothetical protein [Peribacillus simplex]MDP1451016.1 hypothetical protein [Peribacillus frigoritolerans]
MDLNIVKANLKDKYYEYRERGYDCKEAYNKILTSINHWVNELSISLIRKENSMTLDQIKKLSSIVYENVGEWVGAPKVIYSDTLPAVVYDYPKENGNNPLNIECNDKYFIRANGFSYSYSQYLSDSELVRDNEVQRKIPMGYKSISLYEKMVFIKNGQIIKSFEEIPEQAKGDHYTIITTSEYLGQGGYQNSPDLSIVDKTDYLKIKQLAICLSKKDKKGVYLVCKNNDNIYWH